jgi:hypothetical protein
MRIPGISLVETLLQPLVANPVRWIPREMSDAIGAEGSSGSRHSGAGLAGGGGGHRV